MEGRKYHDAEDGSASYQLPTATDEQENSRLDIQHELFLMTLDGSLHRAPLVEDIREVLDIGTGIGIWAIDFAKRWPVATVTGTDLTPVQPKSAPPNFRFQVEDAEKDWTWEQKFDFIHGRMVMVGIRNWPRLLKHAFDALNPGGYIEMQDLNSPVGCDDGSAAPDSPIMNWSRLMIEGAKKMGMDLTGTTKLPQLLREAGFIDVHTETYMWPLNPWPEEDKLKRMGKLGLQNYLNGLPRFTMGFFTRGLGFPMDEVQKILPGIQEQAVDPKSHVYIPISMIWAKKPE